MIILRPRPSKNVARFAGFEAFVEISYVTYSGLAVCYSSKVCFVSLGEWEYEGKWGTSLNVHKKTAYHSRQKKFVRGRW